MMQGEVCDDHALRCTLFCVAFFYHIVYLLYVYVLYSGLYFAGSGLCFAVITGDVISINCTTFHVPLFLL